MAGNDTVVIVFTFIKTWTTSRHTIIHSFSLQNLFPKSGNLFTSGKGVSIGWSSAKISKCWSTTSSGNDDISSVCFSIRLLSDCNPKLITISCSKDGFTGPSELFAISFSYGLYVLIEYREIVINPDSLENTIFVEVNTKYLGLVSFLGDKDLLDAFGPFR